jgi:hypothetical protein
MMSRAHRCRSCAAGTVLFNGACTSSCPSDHYTVPSSGRRGRRGVPPTCAPCNSACGTAGCVAAEEVGCIQCASNLRNGTSGACLAANNSTLCPVGTWLANGGTSLALPHWQSFWSDHICEPCDPLCRTCALGGDDRSCLTCAVVRGSDGQCASQCIGAEVNTTVAGERVCTCPLDRAVVARDPLAEGLSTCQRCHSECSGGCTRPNDAASCVMCRNLTR